MWQVDKPLPVTTSAASNLLECLKNKLLDLFEAEQTAVKELHEAIA